MTDKVKHSTSYFHEVLAKAFEMFKNGYEPVMEIPFQPRRQGSAFVVEYKLVREPFDELLDQSKPFPAELLERMSILKEKAEANRATEQLAEQAQELKIGYLKDLVELGNDSGPGTFLGETEFDIKETIHKLHQEAKQRQLTIQEKWEIDDEINFEADEQKKLAESEDSGKIVYSKEELDAMHWDQLKPLLDEAGIKGRRRQNLIRDFLKKQEEKK